MSLSLVIGAGIPGPASPAAPLWPYVLGGIASIGALILGGVALLRGLRKDAISQARSEASVAHAVKEIEQGRVENRKLIERLRADFTEHVQWSVRESTHLQDDVEELQRHTGLRNGRRRPRDGNRPGS